MHHRLPRTMFSKLAGLVALILLMIPMPASALPTASSITALVDKQHPLYPLSYEPSDLSTPRVALALFPDDPEMQLRAPASQALQKLFDAAQANRIDLVFSSGYRSYADQSQLYATRLLSDAASARESVAQPGHSEHQTGLAADIITSDYVCAAQGCFAITKAAAWLQSNAYRYGFILRYPDYKQPITGYEYEPWHYRYVGPVLAQKLFHNHQTLEEYYRQP